MIPLAALQTARATVPEMTTGTWVFLTLGWLFVIGLAIWCFARVLGGGRKAS